MEVVDAIDWFEVLVEAGVCSNGSNLIPELVKIMAGYCTSVVLSCEVETENNPYSTYAYAMHVDPHSQSVTSIRTFFKSPKTDRYFPSGLLTAPFRVHGNIRLSDFDSLGRFLSGSHTNAAEFDVLIPNIPIYDRTGTSPYKWHDCSPTGDHGTTRQAHNAAELLSNLYGYHLGMSGAWSPRKSKSHIDECRAGDPASSLGACLWWVA